MNWRRPAASPLQVWADGHWRTAVTLAVVAAIAFAAAAVWLAVTEGGAFVVVFAIFSVQCAVLGWRQFERGKYY